MDEDFSGNFATDEQLAAECSVCKVNVLFCSAMHRDARQQLYEFDFRHIPTDVLRRAVRLRSRGPIKVRSGKKATN